MPKGDRRSFILHLAASLAAVALVRFLAREVVWKLADSVLVRADAAGFAECAADHPWGAVDWLLRLLAAANLTWWGGLLNLAGVAAVGTLAFLALRHRRLPLAPFAPWLVAALYAGPILGLGSNVWTVPHPHFPQTILLLLALLAASLFAGWKGLLGLAGLPLVLVIAGWLFFDDLAAAETLRGIWGEPLRAVKVSLRDCRDQLAMERAVREQRFEDVLAIAPEKAHPRRMETAWRILALFRTGRIDRDLFRYPIVGSHRTTDEREMEMEGPLLLFHYGLLLPARRWIFESAVSRGWRPQDYRLLGDIALLTGETELARKYFGEYARFPFRGDCAARRLRALERKTPTLSDCPDLADVDGLGRVWEGFARTPGSPVYFDHDLVVERLVYSSFLHLRSCPPEVLKMMLACALLEGHPEILRDNPDLLARLYPDGRIPPAFRGAFK